MISFEAADFADAVSRAAQVAPTKGEAFDKAAGLHFRVGSGSVEIRASNLETTYLHRVRYLQSEYEEGMQWRIPSAMFARLLSALPMGAGHHVKLLNLQQPWIDIEAASMSAKIPSMPAHMFPKVEAFDTIVSPAQDMAFKVKQVAWAAEQNAPGEILSGIHITGTHLVATDRYQLAMMPCKVEGLSEPITAPLSVMSSVLKSSSDVRIAAVDHKLLMELDDNSQATTVIYQGKYPNFGNFVKPPEAFECQVIVNRENLVDTLNRMLVVVSGDKAPTLEYHLQDNRLSLGMTSKTGIIQDSVSPMDTSGPSSEVNAVDPNILLKALNASREAKIQLNFGKKDNQFVPMRVADTSGYEVHIGPKARS